MLKVQVVAMADNESRTFLKPLGTGTAPVWVLIAFAAVRERPQWAGPGRSSRSQTALTYASGNTVSCSLQRRSR